MGSLSASAADSLISALGTITLRASKVIFREELPTWVISPMASMKSPAKTRQELDPLVGREEALVPVLEDQELRGHISEQLEHPGPIHQIAPVMGIVAAHPQSDHRPVRGHGIPSLVWNRGSLTAAEKTHQILTPAVRLMAGRFEKSVSI